MRLAVFTSKYPARVATFFERDMRALADHGIEIHVFSLYPLDSALWRHSDGAVPRDRVHHLGFLPALLRSRRAVGTSPRDTLGEAIRILVHGIRFGLVAVAKTGYVLPKAWAWAAAEAERFDHVLGYWGNYAGTAAYVFHRVLGRRIPFSLWLHAGVDLYRDPLFLREKIAYADNVITCCEFNRRFIEEEFGEAVPGLAAKLHVLHHGLDLEQFPFEPYGRPAGDLVAVGRLARHKGYDDLLRAAGILHRQGIEVTIELVGDGEERSTLERLAAELGIGDRVRFRGWLPFGEARLAMARATALVHPSDGLGDGLPNVIREAMALGTPVVGTRVAGIPDALGDGCGLLAEPRNPISLAERIRTLLGSDPVDRVRMADRARARVVERYDLRRNGARLATLLRESTRTVGHEPVAGLAAPDFAEEAGRC